MGGLAGAACSSGHGGGTGGGAGHCTAAAPCASGGSCKSAHDCPADAGFVCHNNVCAGPCTTDANCAAGEICGTVDSKKMCLRPCMNGSCPAGDAGCETYWGTHQDVCANRVFANACTSVEDLAACTSNQCGPQYGTEWCVTQDRWCPHNGPCDPTLAGIYTCTCESGTVPTSCDGTPCDSTTCVPGEWSCLPGGLPSTDCVHEPHNSSGNCHCADGRVLPFVCGETSSCEDRCATGCNLMAQDCPDSAKPKCTYEPWIPISSYDLDPQPRARPICVALTGTKKQGESCTRVIGSDGGLQGGLDDCDKGFFCADNGNPPGSRVCNKVCSSSADCGAGMVCEQLINATPQMGTCRKSCTLGGNDCAAGQSCGMIFSVEWLSRPYCKFDGPLDAGSPCLHDSECGPTLTCAGKCVYPCSNTVACVSGTCMPDVNNPAAVEGYGVCN